MKNIFRLAFASMVLMVSCAKDDAITPSTAESTKFYASIEAPATRTSVDGEGKLSWSANDEITIFSNTNANQYKYTGESDGKSVFEPVSSQVSSATELTANYAIYPYAANTTISNDGKILYTIPTTQKYAVNSFGLGANVMVAVTEDENDNFLAFKNLCGYFEFSLYGNVAVKSIEFKGNNGEKLAGAATITATNQDAPTFVFANDATETLTLDCGEGIALANAENPTKFWFVVPAITYEKGITITITDTEGKVMEKTTSNSITIERSAVQPLNAFEVKTVYPVIPNNQIWYTSSDGNIVTPYKTDVFGANIESNTYENGRGIITFDGDITLIGESAFYERLNLTSVTIPNSVTSIGDYAFEGCTRLTSVTIPDSVTTIGACIFVSCRNLTSFYGKFASVDNRCLVVDGVLNSFAPAGLTTYTIPDSVTSIGDYAFYCCGSLTSITIPDSVTSIGMSAFDGCSLPSVIIPDSVITIGDRAFRDCYRLESVTIPDSVTSIGKYAFYYCRNLTSVTIPNSVTSIEQYAFCFCSRLTSVTIPDSVTSIGYSAFWCCNGLTSVFCKSTTPPTLGDGNVFNGNASGRTIYVPRTSVEAYNNAMYWSNYADNIVGYNF